MYLLTPCPKQATTNATIKDIRKEPHDKPVKVSEISERSGNQLSGKENQSLNWSKQTGGHRTYTDGTGCPQTTTQPPDTVTESTSQIRMEGRHQENAPTFDSMGTEQGCLGSSTNLQKSVKDDLPHHHTSPVGRGKPYGEARAADYSGEYDGRASEGNTEEITPTKTLAGFFSNELPLTHIKRLDSLQSSSSRSEGTRSRLNSQGNPRNDTRQRPPDSTPISPIDQREQLIQLLHLKTTPEIEPKMFITKKAGNGANTFTHGSQETKLHQQAGQTRTGKDNSTPGSTNSLGRAPLSSSRDLQNVIPTPTTSQEMQPLQPAQPGTIEEAITTVRRKKQGTSQCSTTRTSHLAIIVT